VSDSLIASPLVGSKHALGSHARSAARVAADWLCLAPAPTFAIMALLAMMHGGGAQDMLCAAAPDVSLLAGMVPMYLLMSAFHLGPWLRLLSRRGNGASGPWFRN
jgi:hypothetical protein